MDDREVSVIRKRSGGYGVAVYDPATKRKRWLGTFPTLKEAREVERQESASPARRGAETCDAFADRWLVDYARPAAATRRTNGYALKQFRKDFAKVRLVDVDKPTARAWARKQPMHNVGVVRAMFTDAINDGLHPGPNPFGNLRLEQPRGRKDLIALTEPELWRLADVALACHEEFGPTFRAMIVFAAYVGLRPGEMFALERRDVLADEVVIRQSLDGTGELKTPKNGHTRVVTLPPPARDALRDVSPRLDQPWLFLTPRGRQFSRPSLHYYWDPVRAAFGRPTMDFYELRHFCATHLLERGVSHADVAVQLGHRDSGALVMSTYGHPSEERARERLKRAYETNVADLQPVRAGRQEGGKAR
jgi:integrase